jgi:hypothetical protein
MAQGVAIARLGLGFVGPPQYGAMYPSQLLSRVSQQDSACPGLMDALLSWQSMPLFV